jgi:FXSXX-COOH protein
MPDLGRDRVERVVAEELPRLEEIPLAELLRSADSALAQAIVRVLEADEREESYAAHGSSPVT